MTGRIFRRIFIIFALVAIAAAVVVEVYITSVIRTDHIENLRRSLQASATLISKEIPAAAENLDLFCRSVKADINARVTVIMPDGRVAGDSDHASQTMANHSDRTEVRQAAEFGAGTAIRMSDTLRYDFLYVARKVAAADKGEVVIRLAVPLEEVDAAVDRLRLRIILVVLAVLMITWAVAAWQTEHLRRLLRQITDFSKSLSSGDLKKRLFLENAGEFEEIASNLTAMSVELEKVLSENEEEKDRLNVILKSVPDALLIIDLKGVVMLSSSSAADFFGEVPSSGAGFAETVRNHEFAELIEKVRRSRLPGLTEFSIEAPAERHLSVRVSPLFYGGDELSGFVAVFHDLTEIRKLEQVRKDFVANVSHELKTPITAIKGFADTLLDGALEDGENASRFVRTIKSNSERIDALVDDLMTISRIELGVVKVEKTEIDPEEIFEGVVELFRTAAHEKGLSLKYSTGGVSRITADGNRLMQILTNLLDNAIKFTDKGGVTLGMAVEGEKRFLFVEDTGIGVPSKFVSRLGERFFRVDPARSRKMGGTGLGLAIVKHLVKAHGWSMKIESVQGKGTKVRIFI